MKMSFCLFCLMVCILSSPTCGDAVDPPCVMYATVSDVVGEPSVTKDDDVSIATCPDGTQVFGCRCSVGGNACDGVEVIGQQCKAWKGGLEPTIPIQAKATCTRGGSFSVVREPADGKHSKMEEPVVTCPCNTTVVACWLHNWWVHHRYVTAVLDKAGNSCKTAGPCKANHGKVGCVIQALCQEQKSCNCD